MPPDARKDRSLQILVLVCLGQFMLLVDDTIVNVALPSIQADLGFSESGLTWVANAYFLAFGGFLLLGGKAADLLGRRRVLVVALGAFATASAVCGLAPSSGVLVAARGVQGLAGAFLSPAALSILLATFPSGRQRTQALGAWAALTGIGRRDRAPRGRRARRALRLALGLPHQRPRRPRGRAARAPRRPGRPAAGHGARAPRRARRAPRDRSAARLHAQRGPDRRARLALGPDAGRLRRRDRPGDRRVPARAALAGAAHPARAAAVTDDPGGQHDDAHRRGRAVRDVLLPHPVHADRAGLGRVGDRRRLPAVLVRHGRHERRRREVARRALGARAAARRARHRRGRTVAHERSGGDERVHRAPAARPGRDGVRARPDVRAPHQRRHRRRGRGRRGRRVRPADDVPADRRGARHRGHGHDRDAPDRCAVAAGTAPAVAAVEGFQAAFRVQAIVLAAAGLLALLLRAEPRARPRQEANPGSAPRATSAV